jgi:DNA sulfur modification protein DndD
MFFESLSLHNFGAYCGEHSLALSTSPAKPIILIGALNGSGKTTLLEAVQLALFGKAVRGTSRSKMSYAEYLLQSINKNADPESGASVSLEFRQRQSGHDDVFSVTRTWKKVGDSAKESLVVLRNGVEDAEATERWLEFVEEFLPVQIADLFLFDGERIETLADPERSSALLRTGVHALLGLDLVDHLSRSLQTLERRKRSRDSSTAKAEASLEKLEAERSQLQERSDTLVQGRASTQLEIDRLERDLASIRQSLTKDGGKLYSNKEEIVAQNVRAQSELEKQAALMQELANGDIPLLLVQELLPEARELVAISQRASLASQILRVVEKRDLELLKRLKRANVSAAIREEITSYLSGSNGKLASDSRRGSALGRVFSFELSDDSLEAAMTHGRSKLRDYRLAAQDVAACELRMAAVPSEESLRVHLDKERSVEADANQAMARLSLIDEELRLLRAKIERAEIQLESSRADLVAARLEDQDANRIVLHSERARITLSRFREAVAVKSIARLESLVAERFKALLRKSDGPVGGVRIDPRTFELLLLDNNGRPLNAMLLSAGERQLLAVATVWALAKASGRSLPTIIDTPLGRLDSEHRIRLVDNYFPAASHQVVLLSTDEEINGRYYSRLKPRVAREYVIQYDSRAKSSRIDEGYFLQRDAAA